MLASLRKRKLVLFKQQDLPAPATESQGSGFLCLWHPQLCHEQLPSWEQYRLCHCKHLILAWQFPEEDRDLLLLDLPLKNEASAADTGLCHLNTSFGDGDFTSRSLGLMISHCWVSSQELNSSKQGFLHKGRLFPWDLNPKAACNQCWSQFPFTQTDILLQPSRVQLSTLLNAVSLPSLQIVFLRALPDKSLVFKTLLLNTFPKELTPREYTWGVVLGSWSNMIFWIKTTCHSAVDKDLIIDNSPWQSVAVQLLTLTPLKGSYDQPR